MLTRLSEERNYERPGHYYGDREPHLRRPLGMGYHNEDNYQGGAKPIDRSNSGNTYTEGTDRLSEEMNFERPGHYYGDREPYLRRPLGMGYHDEGNYQGGAKSIDRSNSGNTYTESTDRNQNHFLSHSTQHFEQQRYPVGEQYSDERDAEATTPGLNRRTNNNITTPVVASVASPTATRSESRPSRTKCRSRTPSRTPSGFRSRSRSFSGSRSSSSFSKVQATSSNSSIYGRSRSPSKSRSPAASYLSQNNTKGSQLDRLSTSSPIANPKRPLGICVRNLPIRSTDKSLKDGLFHEYKKHGKVTMVKVTGKGTERYAVVYFKKPEDVEKALEVSKDKRFFGSKIEVTTHEGLDAEDNEFKPLEAELDGFHPKATRTLFIGNLEKNTTTAELRKHFDQFGEIIEIEMKKQGSATSYAFIQYSDIVSVLKAIRKLDGENLGANRIKLGFGKSLPTNCVWLDGVSKKVTENFLRRYINERRVTPDYVAIDKEKGHALVFFKSVKCAERTVSDLRGRYLQGKKLQVDFASRELQTTFCKKLGITGQLPPGKVSNHPMDKDQKDKRSNDSDVVRNDDRPEDVEKALEVSRDKNFFGSKIEVTAHEGLDAEDNEFRPLEAELDEYHPNATRILFIGKLEKDITTAELRKPFEQFGEIIEIDIKRQGSATSMAFIHYSDIASVVKALRKLNGENLGANHIKWGFGKSIPTDCVWLDGVSEKVTENFLRHYIDTRLNSPNYVVIDREKGHALVFFESVECAQKAVSELRGRILQGKKLQVDFASRECQATFFEKLKMRGQLPPGEVINRLMDRDRRDRRSNDFDVVRNDDREAGVGFENCSYARYEGQTQVNHGNFRGNQRTDFSGMGRGQNFPHYEVYHDEFGERRHRYRQESETAFIHGEIDIRYADNPDYPSRKRNKLCNSISDQESHYWPVPTSISAPGSEYQSCLQRTSL